LAPTLGRLCAERLIVVASSDGGVFADLEQRAGVLALRVVPGLPVAVSVEGGLQMASVDRLAVLERPACQAVLARLLHLDMAAAARTHEAFSQALGGAVATAGGVHIFGAGTVGRQILGECRRVGVPVLGFVDSNPAVQGQSIDGVPVGAPAQLAPERDVVIVSVGCHARAISADLRARGVRHVVSLPQFFYFVRSAAQPEIGYLPDLEAHRREWLGLALRLEDDLSWQVLDAVLHLRTTLECDALAALFDRGKAQWFEPDFLRSDPQAVFVDGGAYDGDTAEAFRRINGPARAIHAFELDPDLAERARRRLAPYPEAIVHAMGVSDRRATLGFLRTGVTDGHLSDSASADGSAEVCAIDEVVTEPLTFLKLDVEGEEAKAIAGAARQIASHKPLVALAVYHRAHDIWSLPDQLLRLNGGYKLFLRHYTEVAFETVLYAVDGRLGDEDGR